MPGAPGDPDVVVRVYTPAGTEGPVPALYWIHGGGMVLGDVAMDDLKCKAVALETGCLVASVEYRLVPEHPHPAPIEHCYAGLKWLAENAGSLGVDSSRIAIGGASAGGGLAAALALLARDRAEVQVIFQQLIYPMLDDRNITPRQSPGGTHCWGSWPVRTASLPTLLRPGPRTCRACPRPSSSWANSTCSWTRTSTTRNA